MPRKARKTAEEYTREELYARAEKAGIKYRSRMNKEQLFAALGLGGTKPPAAKAARAKTAKRPAAPKAPRTSAAQPKTGRARAAKPAAPAAAPVARPTAPAVKPAAPPPAPLLKPAAPPAAPVAKPAAKPVAPAPKAGAARATASAKTSPTASAAKADRAKTAAAPAKLEPAVVRPGSLPAGSVVPPPAAGPIYVDRGPALPAGYGEDRIVALVRDPRCIFAYWELGGGGVERAKSARGGIDGGVWVLRLVKVIGDRFFDVPVDPASGNFYLHVEPGERYQVKIGMVLPSGSFVEIAASQEVVTPAENVSDVVDEQWMLVREEFDRLIEEILGARGQVGMGASELIHRLMGIPRRLELFSGAITSPRGGQ